MHQVCRDAVNAGRHVEEIHVRVCKMRPKDLGAKIGNYMPEFRSEKDNRSSRSS